jgi:hypothetical protein
VRRRRFPPAAGRHIVASRGALGKWNRGPSDEGVRRDVADARITNERSARNIATRPPPPRGPGLQLDGRHSRGEFEPHTWDIFWRTVIDGCSPTILAEELGTTPAAVRQAKSRVLRRLKQEMGELLD